jgi:hypothetical protein
MELRIAAVIGVVGIILALAVAPDMFTHSMVRGLGWGIGREVAHGLFHGR